MSMLTGAKWDERGDGIAAERRKEKRGGETDLMKSVSTFGNDVGFFAWQSEAETQGFETDGTLLLVAVVLGGDDWDCAGGGGGIRMGLGGVLVVVGMRMGAGAGRTAWVPAFGGFTAPSVTARQMSSPGTPASVQGTVKSGESQRTMDDGSSYRINRFSRL